MDEAIETERNRGLETRDPERRLIELLSVNPAKVINVTGGSLAEGAPADITILAPDLAVTVVAAAMKSKSKNTPFDGWQLRGGVAMTIVGGRTVYINSEAGLRG